MTQVQMRKAGRYYWPPNDETAEALPSVTMITGNLDKSGALAGSAAKITAQYAVDNVLGWETIPADDAVKLIKKQYRDEWNAKMRRGSDAHDAIEQWMRAEKAGEVAPELENIDMLPYLAGAMAFTMDWVGKIGAVEASIFNLTYKYAGTTDALVQLRDGSYAIVDWKTGGIYEETGLQLTAYAHGEFIGTPTGKQITLDYPITKGIAVQVPGDGTYTAYVAEFPCGGKCQPRKECASFRGFVGLRGIQKWSDHARQGTWVEKWKGDITEHETDDAA